MPAEATWTSWGIDTWLSHLQGRAASIIFALVMLLLLSFALQVRTARRLRRARQEVGQILDLLDEIYAGGALARTGETPAIPHSMTADAPTQPPRRQGIEFSPTEGMVLQVLSEQPEVQERELGKILAAKGFKGVLIKAIIGEIVRKTGMMGLPWVGVRCVQGDYLYRLDPSAAPNLVVQGLVGR
jgi:hypothetical protein